MLNKSNIPVLLIIDVQKGIDDNYWGNWRNNVNAENKIASLLKVWRKHTLPIVHLQHCSKNVESPYYPNQAGHDFKDEVKPLEGEVVIQKEETSAFIRTDLESHLHANNYDTLVITGVITNNSVEATARMAGNLGFKTVVVSDATATFEKKDLQGKLHPAKTIHSISLANLQGEYASILSTREVTNSLEIN